jgi:predicted O-methyltransferase YrrM
LKSDKKELVQEIIKDAPKFHRIGRKEIIMHPGVEALDFIAENTLSDDITIETGSGYSSVVFIACGANHTVVVPDQEQIDKIRGYCAKKGFNDSKANFICESSDTFLPRMSEAKNLERDLDFTFIDGQHAFPFPVIDWAYTEKHIKKGGLIGIDDTLVPAISILTDFMDIDWNYLEEKKTNKTFFYRVGRVDKGYEGWGQQPYNTFPQYLQKIGVSSPGKSFFDRLKLYLKKG